MTEHTSTVDAVEPSQNITRPNVSAHVTTRQDEAGVGAAGGGERSYCGEPFVDDVALEAQIQKKLLSHPLFVRSRCPYG